MRGRSKPPLEWTWNCSRGLPSSLHGASSQDSSLVCESNCFRRRECKVLPRSLLWSWAVARFSYESNEFKHRRRCWELKKSKRFCKPRTQTGPAANESWSCWLVTYQRNNSISHWKCVNALTLLTSHFSHMLLVNSQNYLDLLWKQASISNPG